MDKVTVRIVKVAAEDLEKLRSLPALTAEDIMAADRYERAQDKALHLVSAYLKRRYVGAWRLSDTGKPIADGVFFSVSHTDGSVAFVTADRAIGIDLERVRETDREMRDYVLSPEERGMVSTDEDFFRLWTAKESLVKAHGAGFDREPIEVPASVTDGVRRYDDKVFYSRSATIDDAVLSVTMLGDAPFDLAIEKENLL